MDFLKVSSALGHQAQALAALQRTVDLFASKYRNEAVVKVSALKKLSLQLRQNAELSDQLSILLDQEVEVKVQA